MSNSTAAFTKQEISNMAAATKYKVSKSDTLSLLTIKFKNSFPSLKTVQHSSLENKIYNENKSNAFNKNKDTILLGKELTLKFISEYRQVNLKIDKKAKEYIFTEEDKLVFNILKGQESFWNAYKELSTYMNGQFKKNGKTTLPNEMALNTQFTGTVLHKKMLALLKKDFSQAVVVNTEEIIEKILKLLEKKTSTSQEKQELAKKLEKENALQRTYDNCSACIPKDQIDKLATKCIEEFYCKMSLTETQKKDLAKGSYTITDPDLLIAQGNSSILWGKICPNSQERLYTLETRKKKGENNNINTMKKGDKVFVLQQAVLSNIEKQYKDSFNKLVELAKICDIKLPIQFIQNIDIAILQATYKDHSSLKLLDNISWQNIEILRTLPKNSLKNISKLINEVLKI